MTNADRLAQAALSLVGTPFRMHGRDPVTGLDCVGLVAVALARIGRAVIAPSDYRLRGGNLAQFDGWALASGFGRWEDVASGQPGDVLLCEVSAQQFHAVIDAGGLFVHAHIALGRVIAHPPPLPWPVQRRWCLQEKG
ncbi:C40 family peptidase [Blastomonas sp. AAP53]|uniref:C40 family peptidase n=1 Tax=Blastomonas sp. AAP53 TaxID=1248760 RepID=UPI00031AD988|nr:C40 family peptidase [Blastomonas sp. AAP53]